MDPTQPARRAYFAPRLAVYGRLEDLTLTATLQTHKNDAIQGQNNMKT